MPESKSGALPFGDAPTELVPLTGLEPTGAILPAPFPFGYRGKNWWRCRRSNPDFRVADAASAQLDDIPP